MEAHALHPNSKLPRLEVVDALRGFAVMAILLVHNLEHFIFPVYPDKADLPVWLNILDDGVFTIVFALFAGKAYAIFALLFGFTFYIQYTNQEQKGKDFGSRFAWRLLLLVLFATLNAAFFPAGDVLLLFAIVGFLLILVRKWSNRSIGVIALILLFQPVEWAHFLIGLFDPTYHTPHLGVSSMYDEVAEYTKEGNFLYFLRQNITLGQEASLTWAVAVGRYAQTGGLFMLGLLLGRKQLFVASEASNRFWIRALIVAAIVVCPLMEVKSQILEFSQSAEVRKTVVIILDMWQKLAYTVILVSSFVLLYQTERVRKLTASLRFYGRMSLSNYIGQSIIGAFLYFPFGLYLAPRCGYTLSLLIGIGVFVLQLKFCQCWLSRHKQGPLETIWHKLTWLQFEK